MTTPTLMCVYISQLFTPQENVKGERFVIYRTAPEAARLESIYSDCDRFDKVVLKY